MSLGESFAGGAAKTGMAENAAIRPAAAKLAIPARIGSLHSP
jgi:hypothetical protein